MVETRAALEMEPVAGSTGLGFAEADVEPETTEKVEPVVAPGVEPVVDPVEVPVVVVVSGKVKPGLAIMNDSSDEMEELSEALEAALVEPVAVILEDS